MGRDRRGVGAVSWSWGWLCVAALYALGLHLMIDNIRAQPHENAPKRGYGFILLALIVGWPFVVIFSLLSDFWHHDSR